MNSKLSIIVLDFNGADDTIECIESLSCSTEKNFNLIVVDNRSEEVNYNKLLEHCKRNFKIVYAISGNDSLDTKIENLCFLNSVVTIIRNDENYGFAIGNNIGSRFALNNGTEQILLLNNDTLVTPSFLTELISFSINNPVYVALTPMICLADSKDIIWNCGGKVTWFGNRRYYFTDTKISKVPEIKYSEITFITGCALFFKPDNTGLLTEQFFFGEEDFEFSLRLLRAKQKMACVYSSLIYHKVGRSIKKNYDLFYNRLFLHYVSRLINHKMYYSKNFRWFIKKMHLVYGFYLTLVRYRYGLMKSIRFWNMVNKYVMEHDRISKSDFLNIMKLSF
jgi:hypothetical protein